jgi:hypothetical protein
LAAPPVARAFGIAIGTIKIYGVTLSAGANLLQWVLSA